jgi:hypothetical protein
MRRENRRKTVEIDRGLYLVRYATAEDAALPPKIALAPEPGSERLLQLIAPPDEEPTLWRPGACLVVRASAPGRIIVEATPQDDSISAAASVRVEPLTQGRSEQQEAPPWTPHERPFDPESFALTGHVAGLGDIRVSADEWIAGPSAPSRIEGIRIDWDGKPEDLELRYSVTTAKPQVISQRLMDLGDFAGTRGKALALVGLAFELACPDALNVEFLVEAIFLGSPVIRRSGKRVFLSGPTGREPLVGLKVAVQKVGEQVAAQPLTPLRPKGADGRVRVFRGRPNAARPDAVPRKSPPNEVRAREN